MAQSFSLSCLAVLLLATSAIAAPHHLHERGRAKFAAETVQALSVMSPAGELKIRAKRGNEITVHQNRTLGAATCAARLHVDGTHASLIVSDTNDKPCAVDVELLVPPQIAITVQSQDGGLLLSGTHGELKLHLAHGNAVVGGVFDKLDAQVDMGSISVQGLNGDGVVHAATGNVQVYFAPKAVGTLTLDVTKGNATVFADQPVSVAATTSSPSLVSNGLPAASGEQSGIRVEGDVHAGHLTIKHGR